MLNTATENSEESKALEFLYNTIPGRTLLRLLISRNLSKLAGKFLSSALSKPIIPGFIKNNNICLDDYICKNIGQYRNFNDFFTRQIKSELRPIDMNRDSLIAPCDGRLSVYRVSDGTVIPVKQSMYKISDLLGGNNALADKFNGGICLVFRLCVDNYHRYCWFDSGTKGEQHFIPGKLHTVRPIALRSVPVFSQNCREYTIIESTNFGTAVQIEVGAMLVGKIENYPCHNQVIRGSEKGKFLYGGSTVILLLEKDCAVLPDNLWKATTEEKEICVKMGEKIGQKI